MTDAIQELKIRAEILHRRVQAREPGALERLRALPGLRCAAQQELLTRAGMIQRRHCLAVLAAELGFPNWPLAKRVLAGEGAVSDFGSLLCPARCGGHVNNWFASYSEAASVRESCRGYLLAYRRQFVVVDRHYIESLGQDPEDPDWEALGFDWARPNDVGARSRLYAKLVAALPREAA